MFELIKVSNKSAMSFGVEVVGKKRILKLPNLKDRQQRIALYDAMKDGTVDGVMIACDLELHPTQWDSLVTLSLWEKAKSRIKYVVRHRGKEPEVSYI